MTFSKTIVFAFLGLLMMAASTNAYAYRLCCDSGDLVYNGGFEINSCPQTSQNCIYDRTNFFRNSLPGWIPEPSVEIGKGSFYNSEFPSETTVLELDTNANSCVSTYVTPCGPGQYALKFNHAARQGHSLETSDFKVWVNGYAVYNIVHTDYKFQEAFVQVPLRQAQNTIKFCGRGSSNGYGAIIDNVSVVCVNPLL